MSGTTSDGAEDAIAAMNPAERALSEQTWTELTERLRPEWQRDGRMAKDAFFAYLKTFPTNAAEMLPVRRDPKSGVVELWMSKRDEKDPFPEYANRWHSPGCMVMPGDTIPKTLNRVVEKETHVGFKVIVQLPSGDGYMSPRGYEIPQPFIVDLDQHPFDPTGPCVTTMTEDIPTYIGQYFPIDNLAGMYERDELIRAQYESFIARAVEWIKKNEDKI